MQRTALATSITIGLTLALTGSAQAQDYGGQGGAGFEGGGYVEQPAPTQTAGPSAEAPRGQVGLELSFFGDSEETVDTFVFVPRIFGWYMIADQIAGSLEWGFPFISFSPEMGDGESRFNVANPFLAGWYVLDSPDYHARFGLGLALPAANIPEGDLLGDPDVFLAALGYSYAAFMDGLYDLWLWVPETFSIVVPGRFEKRFDSFLVGGDAALGVLIPTEGDDRDTEVAFQFAGEFGYVAGMATVGARLQGVWLMTAEDAPDGDDDDFQLSFEPFARFDFGPAFASVRVTMNLDEPGGFAFDDDGVYGVHIGGGANL